MTTLQGLQTVLAKLRAWCSSRDLDRDFQNELDSHLAMLTDEHVRRGLAPDHAARAARLALGGAALKDRHRDARGLPTVDAILQDLRFAVRLIARTPASSAAAIVALTLGIGANAIGFSIVNAALLRGLPFDAPADLRVVVMTARSLPSAGFVRTAALPADVRHWREEVPGIDLACYSDTSMNISGDAVQPERLGGAWLTANVFDMLGQTPAIGRGFDSRDEAPGAASVALISDQLWSRRYGRDPQVLGRTIRINARPATIVGVMRSGMRFPENADVWLPFAPTDHPDAAFPGNSSVIGRLNGHAGEPDVLAGLNAIAQLAPPPEDPQRSVQVGLESFIESFVGDNARTMFLVVMVAVMFVLIIACANVANLLLSRSASRSREIALRMAIGATRGRIVRQLLIESLVLALLAGGGGLLIAAFGVNSFEQAMQTSGKPFWLVFSLDPAVFVYVAAICVLTAALFGLAPALHISKGGHARILKEGGRGLAGSAGIRRFGGAMVVVELALSLILLAGGGLMARSFLKLYALDPGINTSGIVAAQIDLPETQYTSPESRVAFFDTLTRALESVPGIQAAAVTTAVPPLDETERLVEVAGTGPAEVPRFVSTVRISSGFFVAVGRPLLRGQSFTDGVGAPSLETVIVNERFVAEFLPSLDPIGRQIRFTVRRPRPGQAPEAWRTIVAISAPIRHGSPQDSFLGPVVYIPYRQGAPRAASLMVRSALPRATLTETIRRSIQTIDIDQPLVAVQTIDELMAGVRWAYRVFGGLFAILAFLAIALSAVGVYGVMAQTVAERTQEIGVRIALGAPLAGVKWMVLRRGLIQFVIGLPVGLAGAVALGVVLRSILVDALPLDPLMLIGVTLALLGVTVAACLIPASRAARVDPITALRAE